MGLSTPTLRLRDDLCLGAGDSCVPATACLCVPSVPLPSLPPPLGSLLYFSPSHVLDKPFSVFPETAPSASLFSPLTLSPLGLLQPVLTGPAPDQPSQITLCFAAQHRLVHG